MNYFTYGLFGCILVIVIGAVVWYVKYAFRPNRDTQPAHEEKIQAELAVLRSQLQPHLLRHSLDYVYMLAYPVSDPLTEAIGSFSQLMQYALTQPGNNRANLQQEADSISNLMAIYRLRFGDDFNAVFTTEAVTEGQPFTPLMLVPLVADAFAQAVLNDPKRPVRITLKAAPAHITFTISYKIKAQPEEQPVEAALTNIRRQLELTYPNRHELLISANGQTCKSTLILRS